MIEIRFINISVLPSISFEKCNDWSLKTKRQSWALLICQRPFWSILFQIICIRIFKQLIGPYGLESSVIGDTNDLMKWMMEERMGLSDSAMFP
jgi:hypothetical protein